MVDVKKVFNAWAKLTPEELQIELPTCKFVGNDDGILYFNIPNPSTVSDILNDFLGDCCYGSDGKYHYKDGTICKLIITHKWYEFKRYKKVFARICIN